MPSAQASWGVGATRGGRADTYRAAVVPLIAGRRPGVSESTRLIAEEAAHELTRFDAELGERVASFAPVLLRSEAASSSQIENLTASARAIFSAELGVRRSRNADEIAANARAMQSALALADHLSIEAVLHMHRVLMADQPRHTPGQWRDEPVWIGTRSDSPVGAAYVAPRHERIPALMADLVQFMGESTATPLVTVAVAHAQFETIHPFTDGNGRTGRAVVSSLLRARGTVQNVNIPISSGLLHDIDDYIDALHDYRAGNPASIVECFSNAVLGSLANADQLINDVRSFHGQVLDSRTEAGLLREERSIKVRGQKVWVVPAVVKALDDFAERAGRRNFGSRPPEPCDAALLHSRSCYYTVRRHPMARGPRRGRHTTSERDDYPSNPLTRRIRSARRAASSSWRAEKNSSWTSRAWAGRSSRKARTPWAVSTASQPRPSHSTRRRSTQPRLPSTPIW